MVDFENKSAFAETAERVIWRQDKTPHLTASIAVNVLHGESQSESAGPTRGTFAADPWVLIVEDTTFNLSNVQPGDSLTLADGTVLSVQQVTADANFGATIRATSKARSPK